MVGALPGKAKTGQPSSSLLGQWMVVLTVCHLYQKVEIEGGVAWWGVQGKAVPGIVERLLLGLVPALRSGEEPATLHARRLTTALQASCHTLFACSQIITSAMRAFAYGVVLYAHHSAVTIVVQALISVSLLFLCMYDPQMPRVRVHDNRQLVRLPRGLHACCIVTFAFDSDQQVQYLSPQLFVC